MSDTTATTPAPVTDAAPIATTPAPAVSDAELIEKIVKQVEYYFSDSNLPADKFLKGEVAKNPNGFVNIDIIASFNKMKTLTLDLQLVSDALKSSKKLEVSEDGKTVRRVDPLPDTELINKKTLYSKGWPLDTTTIETVQAFFKPYGNVLSVRLRKQKDKTSFKGSMFVDFDSEEIVTKIIAEAPKLNDTVELIYQTHKQFSDEKLEQTAARAAKFGNKRKAKDQGSKQEGDEETTGDNAADDTAAGSNNEMVPGTLLTFKGIGEGLNFSEIKTAFAQYGNVVYVDYQEKEDNGMVRFSSADATKRAMEAFIAEKKELGGKVPELAILEGEEEKEAWEDLLAARKAAAGKGGRGGRGRGRGGRGRGRGRGGFKKQRS
ncbi:hypothetical protein SAMD00019534_023190 [Acytostelium subglobosum LB1]|uniref:hypothetical protein n=1 Tax=Acytostelium subglobosum LB1 TaxID=1410327 RepID=UPI000644C30E|nr:hypothetical protein SAMD00019534_023190 [Acytostelium subglobosum LB1]GAM19144.1 hypothetical protein SAMD00019534_023190 [Acytostelium subglobosum LB1]|eukprot:XP_012757071.1 hypothetical protein SAMD00019534_023190 [Acytostelium subglobosum LB1]